MSEADTGSYVGREWEGWRELELHSRSNKHGGVVRAGQFQAAVGCDYNRYFEVEGYERDREDSMSKISADHPAGFGVEKVVAGKLAAAGYCKFVGLCRSANREG